MSDVLMKAAQLIMALSILVLIHEFGHFIVAKMMKVRVEKFYLFFNPGFSIFKFRKGETEYGLGWLPLGGYVKVSGIIDESMDKEQMKQPPQPWELRSKPAWQRLIFMLGGIIMNVLLGIFIFWMLAFFNGEEYFPTSAVTYGIVVDSTGASLGLKNGDKIIAVDGVPEENFNKIPGTIILNMAKSITVDRNGEEMILPVTGEQIKKVIDSKSAGSFISVRFPFIIDKVSPGTAASEMNLQHRDAVVAINGKPVVYYNDVKALLAANAGKEFSLTVLRDHRLSTFTGKLSSDGLLGVMPMQPKAFFTTRKTHYSLITALPAGVNRAYETLVNYIKQFALIFSPEVQGYKHLGGFITIGNAFDPHWDWVTFWSFTGFLSIALAFMNLLPIPALDGGHVLFTLVEIVTRRKPSDKFLEYAQIAGMAILFALLLFANGNDLVHLFK